MSEIMDHARQNDGQQGADAGGGTKVGIEAGTGTGTGTGTDADADAGVATETAVGRDMDQITPLSSTGLSRRKLLAAMGGLGAAVAAGGLLFSVPQTVKAAISGDVVSLDSVADIQTLNLTTLTDGQHFSVRSFHPGTTVGGDIFYLDKTRPKSAHNGASIVSITVPWDGMPASLEAFLSGTGETDPTGTGCLIRLYGESITPYMFGALANGTADDTKAIQRAIDFAILLGKGVVIEGVFQTSYLRIKNGLVYLSGGNGGGELKAISGVGLAMIELWGPFFGGQVQAVSGCTISGLRLNGNHLAKRGIFGSASNQCVITGNSVYNLYDAAPDDLCGIRLHRGCTSNKVIANHIQLPISPAGGPFLQAAGIQVTGESINGYGGFDTGAFIPPTEVCSHNLVVANHVENGSHGIWLVAAENNTISDNICKGQLHRSIILSPQVSNNVVSGNQCLDFDSSGIHLAYGSNYNIISGNKCRALSSAGEGGIQLYVGTVGNVVTGNEIYCGSNYGIYAAVESTSHKITSNIIVASRNRKAAIAVESDWNSPLPANAIYSRPNYGPPPAPRTVWGISATGHMDISDNTIMEPAAGIAAIYLAQLNDAKLTGVNVRGNVIIGAEPNHYWYFYEQTAGKSTGNQLIGNSAAGKNVTRQYYSRGRDQIGVVANNVPGDSLVSYDVPSGTTQPSAALADYVSLAAYTAATSVTDFTGGVEGQEIIVRLSIHATIIHNSAKIRLKGGKNLKGLSADYYINLKRISGIWFEVSRSF
ncbi:NosD domain-containing protein [Paenibacillus eucommiae]|uniref:Parallel beta-helix repeat protein n=1 Tax=Paenibacillus eucommiae TaxID=1355755 RepID=A0ABS4IW67_9BACL|nr:NosD domain-containing protein [Paenibacillus eucommiae]MBP1991753.1 parallel beta-helix repeat protein [Paenibacillus eucommiae]